jgi:hypothetical protein
MFDTKFPVRDTPGGLMHRGGMIMPRAEELVIKESIRLLCQKVKPVSVLEVGFGYGWSAGVFREHVERHVIVEADSGRCDAALSQNFDVRLDDIHNFTTTEDFALIYDDRFTYNDEPKIRYPKHTWFAETFFPTNLREDIEGMGFAFEFNGKHYMQPLRRHDS